MTFNEDEVLASIAQVFHKLTMI